jgi:hypothetical protein
MTFSHTSKAALTVLAMSAVLASCKKDDDTPATPAVEKPYIVTMAYAPASGYDYSYFTVPFKDLMTGSISAKGQGTEQVGYFDYKKIGTTIYAIGGLNDVKVTALQQTETSGLVEKGSNTFPAAIADIVEADGSNLLAVSMNNATNMISFYQMTKNTVTVAKKVDVPTSDLYTTDTMLGVNYSGMAVVGNKVFLSYYISNKTTFETPNTAQAEVAVYSYPEMQFQNVIRDSRVGPIGGFNVKNGLIEDESGNVYAISNSNPANGFSQSTRPSGILKIANGSSTFDAGYFFDVNGKSGGNAVHLLYLGNGKAFAKLNVTDRAAQTRWSDGMLKAAVIDFNSQTVNMVSGLPEASGDGRRMAAFAEGENVYTVVKETTNGVSENYIYKINTTTFTATKGAKTEASFVAGVFKF